MGCGCTKKRKPTVLKNSTRVKRNNLPLVRVGAKIRPTNKITIKTVKVNNKK
jgi:hypothetical protein